MNNEKQEETQAALGATMSGMAGTQAGAAASGAVMTVRVSMLGIVLSGVHGTVR